MFVFSPEMFTSPHDILGVFNFLSKPWTLFRCITDLLCIGACFSNASESSWLNCAETISISLSSPGAYHMFISSASSS